MRIVIRYRPAKAVVSDNSLCDVPQADWNSPHTFHCEQCGRENSDRLNSIIAAVPCSIALGSMPRNVIESDSLC